MKVSNFSSSRPHWRQRPLRFVACTAGLALLAAITPVAFAAQRSFDSPEQGVAALMKAITSDDKRALRAILGPQGSRLLRSGDAIADRNDREAFGKSYDEAHQLVLVGTGQATLIVGNDGWPMPIPLIKSAHGWRFDTVQGEDEIIKRRIGRNELEAMQVCEAIVDAQQEFAARRLDGDGVPVYAARFTSRSGQRDGLYWPTAQNDAPSPLGPLLAAAADDGYASVGALRRTPYRGYYFRILKSQGAAAPDGALDYVVAGKMIGGFAILAYPARYGASGVMSFLVNHNGDIYQKDLGSETATTAVAIKSFDPGPGWQKVEPVRVGEQATP